jgi:hypothetical protein
LGHHAEEGRPEVNRTPFDDVFKMAKFVAAMMDGKTRVDSPAYGVALRYVQHLGLDTAFVIARGQSQELRKLADALDQYHNCGKVVKTVTGLPLSPEFKIKTRDVLRSLQLQGVKITEANKHTYHKQVRRVVRKYGLEKFFDGTPGQPKKKN